MAFTIIVLLSLLASNEAFTSSPFLHKTSSISTPVSYSSSARTISNPVATAKRIRHTAFFLSASDDDNKDVDEVAAAVDATAEDSDDVTVENQVEETEGDGEEEEETPKEDPEVTAMKEEISKLESQLKSKNLQLNRVKDDADEFTKSGYYRKCAEMDNVRRMRAAANSNNQEASRATTIQEFLPVLDDLRNLVLAYSEDDFAKGYTALANNFENSLKGFGLAEFSVVEGDELDRSRMSIKGEEYSESVKKGAVISVVKEGIEVTGNVIRMAQCVVSMGSEAEAVKEAEEKAKAASEEKAKEEVVEAEESAEE